MNKINSKQQRYKSKTKAKSSQSDLLIYCMSAIVIVIIVTFWAQLKKQIQDNQKTALHQPTPSLQNAYPQPKQLQSTTNTHQVDNQDEPNMESHPESQNEKQTTASISQQNINDLQKEVIKDNAKPYDTFMFNIIQNWSDKKQMKEKFKKDSGITSPPLSLPKVRETIIPKEKPTQTSSNTPPPKTPQGLLRANITAAQLDLAKRIQKDKNQPSTSEVAIEQKQYYQQKYKVSQYKEQPFCIVVPSYNNSAQNRYISNMNSILMQEYSNYHIVFIDDASEDQTGRLMKQYAADHQISEQKLKIVINQNRTMAMPNLYRAAKEFCKPYEIFMIVDGDDQLLGRQVLKHFNSLFQSKDVWVAYTNFISIRGSIGYSRPYSPTVIERNSYRKSGFVISHLRAFYTKLFASVKQEDLQDENKTWFRAANDVAMYMPILEMTHKRLTYCPELSYLYNSNTGLNNHRVKLKQQKGNEKKVKQKPAYAALEDLLTEEQKQELRASLDRKIPIKDPSLPAPSFEVKKYNWES